MDQQFGTPGDTGQQHDGTTFGQSGDDKAQNTPSVEITEADLTALRTRDDAAQVHIPKIESENAELRDTVTQLQADLAKASKFDDVMERISNQPGPVEPVKVDTEQLADAVGQRLDAKAAIAVQDSNWTAVVGKLTEKYGEWELVDREITTRAVELGMSTTDATNLAKQSPDAFYQLFLPQAIPSAPGASSASAGQGQVGSTPSSGEVRDAAYYSKLRRENPNLYWKVETQAQYRRDVHGAE